MERRGIVLFAPRLLAAGFAHGFSLRAPSDAPSRAPDEGGAAPPGGQPFDFALLRAPERLAAALARFDTDAALGGRPVHQCKQVHGARVLDVGDPARDAHATRAEEADALVARGAAGAAARGLAPGQVVGVRVADCVPVLLASRRTGGVAAVHAGWRGLVGGAIEAALRTLAEDGDGDVASLDLVAAIGPSIGPCCFEVGVDVAARIADAADAADAVGDDTVVRSRHEREGAPRAMVDLRRAARRVLARAGVHGASVDDVAGCSRCDLRFHSFRRDGDASGRMLAAVAARA